MVKKSKAELLLIEENTCEAMIDFENWNGIPKTSTYLIISNTLVSITLLLVHFINYLAISSSVLQFSSLILHEMDEHPSQIAHLNQVFCCSAKSEECEINHCSYPSSLILQFPAFRRIEKMLLEGKEEAKE